MVVVVVTYFIDDVHILIVHIVAVFRLLLLLRQQLLVIIMSIGGRCWRMIVLNRMLSRYLRANLLMVREILAKYGRL